MPPLLLTLCLRIQAFFVLPTVVESPTYASRAIQPCTMAPQVIESYSCALYSGGLPLHGRLSVTADNASFSGWRNTKVMLHCVLFHPHQAGVLVQGGETMGTVLQEAQQLTIPLTKTYLVYLRLFRFLFLSLYAVILQFLRSLM